MVEFFGKLMDNIDYLAQKKYDDGKITEEKLSRVLEITKELRESFKEALS